MKKALFISVALGLALGLSACQPKQTEAVNSVSITQADGNYNVSAEIGSFSDFIIVETQMGEVEPRVVDMKTMVDDLAKYDVVFVGEAHGHAASHYVQSKVFSGLYGHQKDLALSMEQFERSQQHIVDEYLAGEIGEETLFHDGKAWDHYRSSYRPLVEFAKNKGLPVIAAEVPGNMVSCVGERGPDFLNELSGEPRTWIADKLHVEDGPYKDKFYKFMEAAAGHTVNDPNESEADKERKKFYRFAAQVSRDDTMAESIYKYTEANPGSKVMHIDGSFHSAGLLGTVERLLLRNPELTAANVHPILVEDPENPSFDVSDVGEGQYLVLLYPTPKQFVKMENISAFIKRTKDKIDENRCGY